MDSRLYSCAADAYHWAFTICVCDLVIIGKTRIEVTSHGREGVSNHPQQHIQSNNKENINAPH